MWEHLCKKGVMISFAYRTFVWDSEATDKAHVHCVIVGFQLNDSATKWLFEGDTKKQVDHINGYLVDAPDTYIKSRGNCLTPGNPNMFKGSQPTDGSYLLLDEKEKENFDKNYPDLSDVIKPYMGSYEFINNKKRYCLWLKGVSPSRYAKNPFILERLKGVVASREKSATASVRRDAETPALFTQIRQPDCDYLAFPAMSSSRRRYMPIGYITKDVIASNQLYVLPSASLYMFGVLTSNIHMAWMRTVCGRLKSDYRYAPAVYNNFPWPTPTDEQKVIIEQMAQAILNARALYPDSSLADLYDPLTMPPELRSAHTANDKAVMAAYGFDTKMTEADCVAELMKKYQALIKEVD